MKKSLIIVISTIVVLFTVGVTYAFFSYTRTGATNSRIVTGDIYLIFNEGSDTLTLTNAMPMSDTNGRNQLSDFEFTVSGVNDSTRIITYNIIFFQGNNQSGTRLSTEFIKLYMTRTVNSSTTTVIDGLTYPDWNNRTVYTSTIPAQTGTEVQHVYNLKMWISNDIWISDTDDGADYTTAQFNSSYQSLKVSVEASVS